MSDDPWGSKIGKELADITRRALIPAVKRELKMKWSCCSGHEHETPEEARECIDELISSAPEEGRLYVFESTAYGFKAWAGEAVGLRPVNLKERRERLMAAVREIVRGA